MTHMASPQMPEDIYQTVMVTSSKCFPIYVGFDSNGDHQISGECDYDKVVISISIPPSMRPSNHLYDTPNKEPQPPHTPFTSPSLFLLYPSFFLYTHHRKQNRLQFDKCGSQESKTYREGVQQMKVLKQSLKNSYILTHLQYSLIM